MMTAGAPRTKPLQHPIIFFDGVCAMCNRFVDLILRADRRDLFRFAPLQGETARALLPPLAGDPREWSMIYLDERGVHEESDASLEVYRRLGGVWWLASLLRLVPRFIRTPAYPLPAPHPPPLVRRPGRPPPAAPRGEGPGLAPAAVCP